MKKVIIRVLLLALVAGADLGRVPLLQVDAEEGRADRDGRGAARRCGGAQLCARRIARRPFDDADRTESFGTVQVTRLAPLGALAREKDLIVEFDDSEVNSRLEEKQLEIDQIDEQIKKAEADLNIRKNQDQVELLSANYSVRRAELEVKRNELLPEIDQKKNLLNLEEAKRRLKQLESDIKSRQEQAEAEIAVLREKKRKAVQELTREKVRLSQVKLLSPMGGLVAIRQNRAELHVPRHADPGHARRRPGAARNARGRHSRSFRAGSGGQGRRTRSRQPQGRPGGDDSPRCGCRTRTSPAGSSR